MATISADQDFLQGRELDGKRAPKFYGDNVRIPHKAQLGCGACIRGGYIFCIPGAEGSDPSTWGTKKPNCCQNSTACPQLTDSSYICSNTYADPFLAKALCPFRKAACGGNNTVSFTDVNQEVKLAINLTEGETCTLHVKANCGIPKFKPNDTTGFDIESVDFDEDDLDTSRILQGRFSDEKHEKPKFKADRDNKGS